MSTAFDDVALFNTIDQLFREQEAESDDERRSSERHGYACVQLLAPFDGERLPSPAEFRQVRCQDLCSGGFSFNCYRRPETKHVVVALGQIPFMFVVAEVRHIEPKATDTGQEYFVGCRFVRKL